MMRVREDVVPVRVSALLLMKMGESRTKVARYLRVSRVTLIKWTRRFDEGGWCALLRDDTGTWTQRRKKRRKQRPASPVASNDRTKKRRQR